MNGHRFRSQPVPATVPAVVADQAETLAAERARADLAEQRLADLRGALPRMVQAKVAYADAERMASGITVGGEGVGLGRLLSLTPT